ncbi:MAG: response regulator [Chloroflexota bacterium]
MHTQLIDKRVLVVDDEANVALLLQRSLALLGPTFQVVVAHSGHQALSLLQDGTFDLVITDFQMPRMNGLELAQAIRGRFPGTKVVLITAYPTALLAAQTHALALDGYLVKPFSTRNLREMVCELLTLPELPFPPQGGNGHGPTKSENPHR